jgi:uncharacterized protein YkwD
LTVVLLLSSCAFGARGLPDCTAPAADLRAAERRVLELVNVHRSSLARAPLAAQPELAAIARAHSRDMVGPGGRLTHDGLRQRSRAAADRLPAARFAENIAATCKGGVRAAEDAFTGWLRSPPHRRALEGDYRVTGVGAARAPGGPIVFTQMFAAP